MKEREYFYMSRKVIFFRSHRIGGSNGGIGFGFWRKNAAIDAFDGAILGCIFFVIKNLAQIGYGNCIHRIIANQSVSTLIPNVQNATRPKITNNIIFLQKSTVFLCFINFCYYIRNRNRQKESFYVQQHVYP